MFKAPKDATVVNLLEELEQTYGKRGMVSLTDLKLEHFYEFQDPSLQKDNSNSTDAKRRGEVCLQ